MRKPLAAVVLFAAGLAGCRSGGPKVVGRDSATSSAWRGLIGQRLLLRAVGDQPQVVVKPGKLPKGTCDVAVEVASAAPVEGGAILTLRSLGRVRIGDAPTVGPCKAAAPQIVLTLAGGLEGHPEEWLQTPEAYLAAHGYPLESRPAVAEPAVAADSRPNIIGEPRRLGRRVTDWPKPLLSIEPSFDGHGKVHHEGEIDFEVVVGADGRLFKPHLMTPLEESQEKSVLALLDLWRFDPAREGKDAVPARYEGRTVLRIY